MRGSTVSSMWQCWHSLAVTLLISTGQDSGLQVRGPGKQLKSGGLTRGKLQGLSSVYSSSPSRLGNVMSVCLPAMEAARAKEEGLSVLQRSQIGSVDNSISQTALHSGCVDPQQSERKKDFKSWLQEKTQGMIPGRLSGPQPLNTEEGDWLPSVF